MILVEGPAGIGKTRLLEAAGELASKRGFLVGAARGGELEREMFFGVARQLLEPVLHRAGSEERAALLSGSAALALSALGQEQPGQVGRETDPFAPLHGLYWLVANLAESRPAALVVDDAHSADPQTLRWLIYLERRLADLRVLVVLAARPGEPEQPGELEQLRVEAALLDPAPLSLAATNRLIARELPAEPDAAFVEACKGATGGNPFLLVELLRAVRAEAVPADAEAAKLVAQLGPASVTQSVLSRLAQFGPEAISLARALAVLGAASQLRQVTELAELRPEQARELCDRLRAAEVLAPGLPVRFVHPLVREAVHGEIAKGERAAAHRRAAEILHRAGAPSREIAPHVVACEPAGDEWVVARLQEAADEALSAGAPDRAAAYLERALAEPPADPARIAYRLGRAKMIGRDPGAVPALYRALELAEEPRLRSRILPALYEILAYAGRWDSIDELIDSTATELAEQDPEAALEAEAVTAAARAYDADGRTQFDRSRDHLRELAAGDSWSAHALTALLAAVAAARGQLARSEAISSVDRALNGGRLIRGRDAGSWAAPQALMALVCVEELERAERLAEEILAEGQRTGAVLGIAAGLAHRGWINCRRGDLLAAEADVRDATMLAQETGMMMALAATVGYSRESLEEREYLEDVRSMVEAVEVPPPLVRTAAGAYWLEVRGRLRLLRGRRDPGIADLRAGGEIWRKLKVSPMASPWRSTLALALPHTQQSDARQLIEEELDLARRSGLARPSGVALRAAGLLEGGERGLELLGESVSTLERTPARYEQAVSLVELGAALRRSNQRAAASEQLETGLALAHRCGAERLVARASEELRATGARPRRLERTGVEALTASELRAAQLAAEGLSNVEIAQRLFVSRKTVEKHLGNAYSKLGIGGRGELAGVLERDA